MMPFPFNRWDKRMFALFLKMKMKVDRFVLAIVVVIVLAYFFPQFGLNNSGTIDTISSAGISLIFFFYGLKLSPEKLRMGLRNWRLHLLVQLTTFLIFPLIILPFRPFIHSTHQETIWLAFLFLAALPSTVSSSVVMVSMAKGNIPAAIFNASISGIIGIAVTPLWMGLFITSAAGHFDLGTIYMNLILQIIVPVIGGILLQRYFGKFAQRYSKQLSTFDKSVILLIIYKSFVESFGKKIFNTVGLAELLLLFVAVIILFYLVYNITGYLSKQLRFDKEDEITARFCGTKKSLVHGTVFSKVLFGNAAIVGLILLPLMIFHAFQILVISIIASRLAMRRIDY